MPKPFLKWVGGKRQLLSQIIPLIPPETARLVEAFAGGAAVFFGTQFKTAILNDVNPELINCYYMLQQEPDLLIKNLKSYRYDKDLFYQVRGWDRQPNWTAKYSEIERAARFIFLNRTGFNGMFRVNAKGQFNVPFGKYTNPTICDEQGLIEASKLLQKAELRISDFDQVLQSCVSGDFVYLDPPYIPISASSNFTTYANQGFDMDAQYRLAQAVKKLSQRNIAFALSNSFCTEVEHLYSSFRLIEVQAGRSINAHAHKRGAVKEYIVTNQ